MRLTLMLMVLLGALSWGVVQAADDKSCIKCHEEEQASHETSLHGKAWKLKDGTFSCSSCHGDGAIHAAMKDPTSDSIISFSKKTKTPADVQSAQCLNCHKNTDHVKMWKISKHATKGVSCSSCHSNHKPEMEVQKRLRTDGCLECHKDQGRQFDRYSHHPLKEGKVTCADCHNPHGTISDKQIKGESVNALCYRCHTDKRGPFLWEHPPVEENCLTCHVAHGSNHDKLLPQRQPNLCTNCHKDSNHPSALRDDADGFGSSQNHFVGRACLNCHQKIHGSHAPEDPNSFGTSHGAGGKMFLR